MILDDEMIDTRRMTDRSRRVLALAESQATRMRAVNVEPEHVLLGLAEEGKGVAANVLRRAGAGFEQLKSALDAIVPPVDCWQSEPLSWSEKAVQAVNRAYEEMQPLNHNYVGTEHLLLAISREADGLVPRLLTACAVRPEDIRCETYNLLGHLDLAAKI